MKKRNKLFIGFMILILLAAGRILHSQQAQGDDSVKEKGREPKMEESTAVNEQRRKLEDGLSVMRYDSDYGFQEFLDAGGASSDQEVVRYLMDHVLTDMSGLQFLGNMFGCSTIQTENANGDILFGRNFDWENIQALILQSHPADGYASISTVNLDFIQSGTSISIDQLPDEILAQVAMYAPLDGMNEKGLAVSVNMIQDSDAIAQSGKMRNLTTTTAIRLLLNKAADVEEAVKLLQEYNLHSSLGMMIHFAIADAQGRSVAVEYVDHEMKVVETPVVTNFYHSDGKKYNVGSAQSHERYDILMELLKQNEVMDMNQVRDALDRVSKDNFDEFASTEWSIVYNLNAQEIHYYHRENYDKGYVFTMHE